MNETKRVEPVERTPKRDAFITITPAANPAFIVITRMAPDADDDPAKAIGGATEERAKAR